jgi:uncharacterized surface anchored protein
MLVLQVLPPNFALATGEDLGAKGWVTVYDTVGDEEHDPPLKSAIKVTKADGTDILPGEGGHYFDVPAGAKIELVYAFSLSDGKDDTFYVYNEGDYFTVALPGGLDFTSASGIIQATQKDDTYHLANWNISGGTLTITLTGEGAKEERRDKWGEVKLSGTFQPLKPGEDTETRVEFGEETIIIWRLPLPSKSTLAKSGSYDAAANEITWTVTVTPPPADPSLSYEGFTVVDTYGDNQEYVTSSFSVKEGAGDAVSVPDEDLVIEDQTISYTFPGSTSGVQTITYKTKPIDFSGANGISTFANTVNLHRRGENAADPVTSTLTLDWLDKTGGVTAVTTDDPDVVKWTVTVKVPGTAGKVAAGAELVDELHEDLILFTDAAHPVQIKFGSAGAVDVTVGSEVGQYSYNDGVLTYRFPDGQPKAGTNAVLTFYIRVKDEKRDGYLNKNTAISFFNKATLKLWGLKLAKSPSTEFTTGSGQGIGSGGLLAKSAGSSENYLHPSKDVITWTITVNSNKITMKNALVEDEIPAGQELLIDGSHPFTVSGYSVDFSTTDKVSSGGFTYIPAGGGAKEKFTYALPETINSTYTIVFCTKITDWKTLYKNGTVGFQNNVKLTRDGADVDFTGTKNFNSQMLNKEIATPYNYQTHLIQWQVVVNRNRLPLTNASVTDTLPEGMTLFIDEGHPFVIDGVGASHDAVHEGTSFIVTLPSPTTSQFTIKFWAKLSDDVLKSRWDGDRDFTNGITLGSDELKNFKVTSTAKIKNPVLTKSGKQGDGSVGSPNEDTIYWSVLLNLGQIELKEAVVTDNIDPALLLELDSIKLYTIAINTATGQRDTTKSPVPVTLAPESITYEDNLLTIKLPDGPQAYLLEFTTVLLDDKVGTMTNSVRLLGSVISPTGEAKSGSISVKEIYSSGGSGSNSLTVLKTDGGSVLLAGAKFRLVNAARQPILKGGKEITMVTDAEGKAEFIDLPSWVFYVEEVEPAPGYLIPDEPFWFGERLSGDREVQVKNDLALTAVVFAKVGAKEGPLSGGLFTLSGLDYKNEPVVRTVKAEEGTVTFAEVPPNLEGTPYTIAEVAPPPGHVLRTEPLSVTVAYNEAKNRLVVSFVPSATFENIPLATSVSFAKVDSGGGLLSGGQFTLTGTDYKDRAVYLTESAVDGAVTFSDIQIGSYTVAELAPPTGYLRPEDTEILEVIVDYNEDRTALVVTIRRPGAEGHITSYENAEALGELSFQKVDASDGKTPLSGGRFELTGTDCQGRPVLLTAASVGGTVTFTGVPVDDGEGYTIKEISPPWGYRRTPVELTARVEYTEDKTGVETSISQEVLTNERVPGIFALISLIKSDEYGDRLAGAEFTLYDSAGNAIGTAISDEKGVANFGYLAEGVYTIKETKAPVGYTGTDESLALAVTDDTAKEFVVVNKKTPDEPGKVTILKKSEKGDLLAGAQFSLYDDEGALLATLTTGGNGAVVFSGLAAGTYTLRETRAPKGYLAVGGAITLTLEPGEEKSFTVLNKKEEGGGGLLPQTGGTALTYRVLLGLVLILWGLAMSPKQGLVGKK